MIYTWFHISPNIVTNHLGNSSALEHIQIYCGIYFTESETKELFLFLPSTLSIVRTFIEYQQSLLILIHRAGQYLKDCHILLLHVFCLLACGCLPGG